ncbi:hypothetical protein KIL84_009109 [Mauremys mutica]|uniref:Uncharacterized protein n=1 Tax=Mauremys mutica TaxID=74926 RepID=A0A9D3XI23_9SAUR|nr:hypothetical protein KIL84_009109 [Mauremys mutica]
MGSMGLGELARCSQPSLLRGPHGEFLPPSALPWVCLQEGGTPAPSEAERGGLSPGTRRSKAWETVGLYNGKRGPSERMGAAGACWAGTGVACTVGQARSLCLSQEMRLFPVARTPRQPQLALPGSGLSANALVSKGATASLTSAFLLMSRPAAETRAGCYPAVSSS